MAQNDLVVVRIDVAKDKVDACIRSFTFGKRSQTPHKVIASWLPDFANTKWARR